MLTSSYSPAGGERRPDLDDDVLLSGLWSPPRVALCALIVFIGVSYPASATSSGSLERGRGGREGERQRERGGGEWVNVCEPEGRFNCYAIMVMELNYYCTGIAVSVVIFRLLSRPVY